MGKVIPTGSKGRGSTEKGKEGQITVKWSDKAKMNHYFIVT